MALKQISDSLSSRPFSFFPSLLFLLLSHTFYKSLSKHLYSAWRPILTSQLFPLVSTLPNPYLNISLVPGELFLRLTNITRFKIVSTATLSPLVSALATSSLANYTLTKDYSGSGFFVFLSIQFLHRT